MRKLIALLFVVTVAGCAYIDQKLSIEPQVSISESNVGQGKKVALRTLDDRSDQLIGKRGVQYFPGGKISNDQDLAEVLKEAVSEGLKKKGFDPISGEESGNSIKAELKSLNYSTSMGLWTGGNIGTSVIKVIATNSLGKTYEKTYRGETEVRTAFVGSQETNSRVVNEAFGQAVDKIFEDTELLNFLVQ